MNIMKSNFLCSTTVRLLVIMLVGKVSFTNGQKLRNNNSIIINNDEKLIDIMKTMETMLNRLNHLETIVQQQQDTIMNHENSIEKQLQTITNLKEKQNEHHRLLHDSPTEHPSSTPTSTPTDAPIVPESIGVGVGGGNKPPSCKIKYVGEHCVLDGDLQVTGHTHLDNGLDVGIKGSHSGCDNCIVFHDDVLFNDVTKYDAPVHFNQPVKFTEDVTIEGMEVPSSKKDKISSDDDVYTSLDFKTLNWLKTTFDADKTFKVTSKAKFEDNVDMVHSDSDDPQPNLVVGGTITSLAT